MLTSFFFKNHLQSALAGPIEALGALLQLPAVFGLFKYSNAAGTADKLSVFGCYFFVLALGFILSTYKRKVQCSWHYLESLFLLSTFRTPHSIAFL
jgi:hypothetical protein